MAFGQLLLGPPGSGKSTYAFGLYQFLQAQGRTASIINLDPANGRNLPYPCAVNIADLITVKDVMREEGLGPNGAILYCIEYLEENFDWLDKKLDELGDDAYVAFDLPGQVELTTIHGSLRRILERLQKKDWRLVAVHLMEASYVSDPSRYISMLLLSLRAMLNLEMPFVNVLSKADLLGSAAAGPSRSDGGESDEDAVAQQNGLLFNLDYYTEVQDLSYLVDHLNDSMGPRRAQRFGELNARICEMVEDFGLVSFETLAVEDKFSMIRLQGVLDKAIGYIHISKEDQEAANDATMGWGSAADVQERWIDHQEDWQEYEEKERQALKQRWREQQEEKQDEQQQSAQAQQAPALPDVGPIVER